MVTRAEDSRGGWDGDGMACSSGWGVVLSDAHRAELVSAAAAVEAEPLALTDLSPADFPLPTLGPVLERLAGDVADGRGFALLQGVPVAGRAEHTCEVISAGICGYIGSIVTQGPEKVPLLHVRDQGVDPSAPTSRSYQHNRRLGYHADPADVVALLCIRPAKSGGLSSLVKSIEVHDEIVRARPDLAEVLYQPWWQDRRRGDGPDSFFQRPVYTVNSRGRPSVSYGPDYIRSAQRGARVPPLSPAQLEAMEVLDRLNGDPRFVLTMNLCAGDMQFLNNHVILHSRTEYEDYPERWRRRDLIRLWLNTRRNSAGCSTSMTRQGPG